MPDLEEGEGVQGEDDGGEDDAENREHGDNFRCKR